jgi:hypothetical protein
VIFYALAPSSSRAELRSVVQLVATSLGLAPFTTAALGDTGIERHLGIDGIGESVLYALGAGRRPSGVRWAPDPIVTEPPASGSPAGSDFAPPRAATYTERPRFGRASKLRLSVHSSSPPIQSRRRP